MYGDPALQPSVAATRQEQLEHYKICELRLITGPFQTTPVATLRKELEVGSMTTLMNQPTAITYR